MAREVGSKKVERNKREEIEKKVEGSKKVEMG